VIETTRLLGPVPSSSSFQENKIKKNKNKIRKNKIK